MTSKILVALLASTTLYHYTLAITCKARVPGVPDMPMDCTGDTIRIFLSSICVSLTPMFFLHKSRLQYFLLETYFWRPWFIIFGEKPSFPFLLYQTKISFCFILFYSLLNYILLAARNGHTFHPDTCMVTITGEGNAAQIVSGCMASTAPKATCGGDQNVGGTRVRVGTHFDNSLSSP